MLFELPFDTVRSTNEGSLEAIKWRGLGVIKVSLVRSDFRTLTCELCPAFACVQTSPISFVARGKGNRRRLHAGNPA